MKLLSIWILLVFVNYKTYSQTPEKTSMVDSNAIVYIIPQNIEDSLEKEILKRKKEVYLELSTLNNGNLEICVFPFESEFCARRTNRVVLINKKFVPLVFDYDSQFAVTEPPISIMNKAVKERNFTFSKSRTLNHNFYYIIFQPKGGSIIKSGYAF